MLFRSQVKRAKEAGLNIPETTVVTHAAQVRDSIKQWPVMLKPADAVLAGSSSLRKGSNWICANQGELDCTLNQWREKYPLLLQPFIAGTGEGVFGLATSRGVQYWSAHRRLRMMNPHGSGSSACISQPVPEALKEPIRRIINESGWVGLFMVELLQDSSGKHWFVEFNGRAWGSMALSRRQGLEYPAWAAKLAMDPKFEVNENERDHSEVTCRNLGREFMHLIFVLRGRKSTALREWPSFWASAAKVLSIRPRDSLYNFRRDDLKVFVSDFVCTIRDQVFKGKKGKLKGKVKAACHIHSDWSYDGKWPLSKLAAQFSRRGYRVLLMTEHDRGFTEDRLLEYRQACAQASSDSILVVPGIEYSDASNTVHVLVWGAVPFLGENLPTAELLAKVKAAGGVAVLAHPSRRNAWKNYDPSWSKDLGGIELWNRKTDGWAPSGNAALLLQNNLLHKFVGMDFHNQKQFFPLATELDLESTVNEESVLDCLRQRRCRATAFNLPLDESWPGWKLGGLKTAESIRRLLARTFRRMKLTPTQ